MVTPTEVEPRETPRTLPWPLGVGVSAAFLVGVVALIAISVVSLRSIRSLVETSDWIAHTQEVLATLAAADADVTSAEASRRGYALTGAERHLDGYEIARSNIAARLDHLGNLTADNPAQQRRLGRLRAAVEARLTALDRAIALRRARSSTPELQAALTDEGEVLMREVRASIDDLSREEGVLLALRERNARASAQRASMVVLLGMAVAIVALGGSALMVGRQRRARQRAEDAVRANEAILQRLNLELARNVEELTAVNGELEAFSYSVSHDLRAPLRHINGFVDLLQRRAGPTLDETARRYLTTIAGAAKQMGHLIDDLLSFSRMGRGEVTRSRVRLAVLLAEVRDSLGEDTRGRDVAWRVNGLPEVVGDPAMLRVVLTNLLSNALKYSRTRGRTEIEVGWRRGDDGLALLWVRDNGVGFDMQYAAKLFGVFQRLHRAAEFEGTGIGLATVRRIVHRHGGRTWAEAAVDAGATIYFSLPLYEGGAA
ncbi:MAG TPA: CHASE3 domain-containing protein [Vicinamibacteria bacterium]|nr:CHASE3 domain-containing protein [Vicinamibacteria bacterium]